jgi:urease accessory protein
LNGLRFVDSFFPSGGYAFSSGLEAAVQAGAVQDADSLSRYVDDLLRNGTGRCEAVAVSRAHEASANGDLVSAVKADQELDAMKLCHDTRMASRQMGRQVIRISAERREKILHEYRDAVEAGRSPGHLAVSLGLTLAVCGWGREDVVAAYLYQTAVGLISAALRLLPIGQREAQQQLASWLPLIHELSKAAPELEMLSWTPVQDIHTMRHAHLTIRLFRS